MSLNILPYLNVPYENRGTFPESADCWTLAKAFLERELGFVNVPTYYYDVDPDEMPVAGPLMKLTLADECQGRWVKVERDQLQFGDILVYEYRGAPWHVGVYLGVDSGQEVFLHTRHGVRSRVLSLECFFGL